MSILKRFLRYVSIDTTSDSSKEYNPSTEGQNELATLLFEELKELGVKTHFDKKNCYLYGVFKGEENLPKVGFMAHLDTAEDASGKNIKPNIINDYDGESVWLNEDILLDVNVYSDLKNHVGKTLITTDGTSLLGADDKAGIAEIMDMLQYYANSNKKHGDIYVCFTPDEEIGLGTLNFDKKYFAPDFAYTVDGSSVGEFSYENFNAATATIEIEGVSTHCGSAKGIMINAGRIATIINSLLPNEIPETTENYEGFFHLDELSGNVSRAKMKYLIRDFDASKFEKRKEFLRGVINELNGEYSNCIKLTIKDTYRNMYEVINKEPELVKETIKAIEDTGIVPQVIPIRGGTDGTEISYQGIPCPNLGTGGHNFHSVYEYICVEDMQKTSELLCRIVNRFSNKKIVKKR